jgi:hypothetical protein
MSDAFEVPIPAEYEERWTAIATGTRTNFHIIRHLGPPLPGSKFHSIIELPDRVDARTKAYITAGIEHLHLWADHVAPFKFHPEQRTRIDLRPGLTLARAAMECAAHALWIFGTRDIEECVRRHIALLRWDLQEHRKSKQSQPEKQQVQAYEDDLVQAVSAIFTEEQTRPPNGYLQLFQQVCSSDEYTGFEITEVEPLWRAASGAAHGKVWVGNDLQVDHLLSGADGATRSIRVPSVEGILSVLEMADRMVLNATFKQVLWSGYDPTERSTLAFAWIGQNMTFRDGVDPAVVERMKRGERPFSTP